MKGQYKWRRKVVRPCKWAKVTCMVKCLIDHAKGRRVCVRVKGKWEGLKYVRSYKWERGACRAWEKGRGVAFRVLGHWVA